MWLKLTQTILIEWPTITEDEISLKPGPACKRRYEANITCTTYVIPVQYPSQPEEASKRS